MNTEKTPPVLIAREDELVAVALGARQNAYAPYSHFEVGAALLCDDGNIIAGVNVENASYGLCVCAERTALNTAMAQGKRRFVAIAVATSSTPPSSPCGMCRQVLSELAPGIAIVMVNPKNERIRTDIGTLFPSTFTPALLQSGQSGEGSR